MADTAQSIQTSGTSIIPGSVEFVELAAAAVQRQDTSGAADPSNGLANPDLLPVLSSPAAPDVAEGTPEAQEDDGMDVDTDENKGKASGSRSRLANSKSVSGGGLADSTDAVAAATAADAAGLDGLPPRMPMKQGTLGLTQSGSGGEGEVVAPDAGTLAGLGVAGFETGYENYDSAMFGLSGDLDEDMGGTGTGTMNRSRQDKLKEKNRLAQRRFRARQKNMLEQMQARMDELNDQVDRNAKELGALQKDNQLLKAIVQEQQKVLLSAVVVVQQPQAQDPNGLQLDPSLQQQAALLEPPSGPEAEAAASAVAAAEAAAAAAVAAANESTHADEAAAAAATAIGASVGTAATTADVEGATVAAVAEPEVHDAALSAAADVPPA